ncbi:MAG: class I SAM-dependent methyltransferase [Rhodospirillaceae bacterium]|nr:class I SAM-dependent methyltransferase [Rhodospirillaceae bacterium]
MWQDVGDLKHFYDREIGHTARHLLRLRIRSLWPDLTGQRLLGIGYAIPYLRQFLGEAERIGAIMPAAQGVMPWPRDGAGMTVLSDETELPFQDNSIDRILLVHALESSEHPGDMLKECWRVLAGGGRLMVAVPNRRSYWSHLERTPFGPSAKRIAGMPSRGRAIVEKLSAPATSAAFSFVVRRTSRSATRCSSAAAESLYSGNVRAGGVTAASSSCAMRDCMCCARLVVQAME